MRVVDAIVDWFETIQVEKYFGYAGGAVWPFMDALIDHPEMEGIQAKHESHAVHMADIYYRTSGKVAPVIVTKGPGLLNCVGGVASAMHDMSAVMLIAGSGSTHFLGKGGMQEIYYKGFEDAVSVLRPVTKGSWQVVRPDTVIEVLNQAYKLADSGRPGPVFVQVPFDIQLAEVEGDDRAGEASRRNLAVAPRRARAWTRSWSWLRGRASLPARRRRSRPFHRRSRGVPRCRRAPPDPARDDAHGEGAARRDPSALPRRRRSLRHAARGRSLAERRSRARGRSAVQ